MAGFTNILRRGIATAGQLAGLPEFGLSELGQKQKTQTRPYIMAGGGSYVRSPLPSGSSVVAMNATYNKPASTPQVKGPNTSVTPTPNTSGQAPGGGGGGGGGGGADGTTTLTPPQYNSNPQSDQNQFDLLKQQYGNNRSYLESQGGQLDATYNLAKGDIESAISDTETAANTQKEEQKRLFGEILRNQLQTYQDLNKQRMGTFSALGSLDSSEYQNQLFRGDQQFTEQRGQTETEQARTLKQIDDQVLSYRNNATRELSRLALQYQSGKQGIQSALAQNNLQEAAAIQSALDQIAQRAQEVQNSMIDFANNAALLKAQGVDVRTNLGGISGNDYANYMSGLLANQTAGARSMYTLPTTGVQGAGYIGSGTTDQKKKNPFLTGLGV